VFLIDCCSTLAAWWPISRRCDTASAHPKTRWLK
jgi:hypothetical protein